MWAEHRRAIHITQAELLCKNGCGFYGNAAWQGHCSKCWRDRTCQADEKKSEEKSRRSSTIRKLFLGEATPPKGPGERSRRCKPGDFTAFLKLLRSPASQRLQSRCTAFLNTMEAYHALAVEKQSDLVQEFYQNIAAHFNSMPEEQVEQMMEHMEKLVMTRLHKWVFCHDSCDDEQKDLALQRRIRSLKWVTPQMLRVPFTDRGPEDADPYLPAITAIIEMDAKRAPQDKLCCVSKCSRNIFQAVGSCKSEPACADDFLSALIYVVLCANPPRLHSNMQYVARFGLPHSCAVAFIEKLDAAALGLSPDEFRGFMQGGRGHRRRQEHVMEQARSLQAQLQFWFTHVQVQRELRSHAVPLRACWWEVLFWVQTHSTSELSRYKKPFTVYSCHIPFIKHV
uniref:Rab5 GDP/GTP exchange factor n=1 Tax=Denticeps clupeoides TaxID=299321 RepID=A0AAY4BMA9_9TELE